VTLSGLGRQEPGQTNCPDPVAESCEVECPAELLARIVNVNAVHNLEGSAAEQYPRFLPTQVDNVACAALVDSGNPWRNVISKDFLVKLGWP
jgi:hypothetical protein